MSICHFFAWNMTFIKSVANEYSTTDYLCDYFSKNGIFTRSFYSKLRIKPIVMDPGISVLGILGFL